MFSVRRLATVRLCTNNIRQMSTIDTNKSGAIREAGGSFAKMEVAKEEEFFYKQQKEQLKKLKQQTEAAKLEKKPKK